MRARASAIAVAALAGFAAAQAPIYQTAVDNPALTTLAALLSQAGLATTFNGTGAPLYTVFAPTNAAFAAIPAALVNWLQNPRAANAAALASTLSFHANNGQVPSSAIPAGGVSLTTLCTDCVPALNATSAGGSVTVRSGATTVLATVTTADVPCSNGVVHVVDKVLVPTNKGIPTLDVVQVALGQPTLSTLVTSLNATGLVSALTIGPSTPSFTVFAPIDSGWSGVPARVSGNLTTLADVLKYHVIVGRVYSTDLPDGVAVNRTTLNGQVLSLVRSGSAVTITSATNTATVTMADVDSSK